MITKYKEIAEGKLFKYFACSDGYILRVTKSTYAEKKVKPYLHHNQLTVKINNKDLLLGQVIAKHFVKGWYSGCCIFYKDNNRQNCCADNLIIGSYEEHGKNTGIKADKKIPIKITFPDGKTKEYISIRAAAKDLYCSYQTISDYMNGHSKTSVLQGLVIERIKI